MGRRRQTRILTVWMNGERVGDWRRLGNGGQEFVYAEAWLASPAARPISLSLPLRPSREPYRAGVEAFFDNLLPDSRVIRERLQQRFHAVSLGAFDLLAEVGRDCVGALQLLPEGLVPTSVRKITGTRLNPSGVAELLRRSLAPPLHQEEEWADPFRISLAGAQEKMALLWHQGAWHCPTGSTPTTHIFKFPMGTNLMGIDLSTSVENEWLCSEIVRAYGIPVAACRMATFGGQKTLIVERFDRRLATDGGWCMRLPQEDFCQATATPPGLKYESDGGPGMSAIMELLLGAEQAVEDRRDFMRTQVVFWMLAAIDGHAKNFSICWLPGSAFKLAPRYDILSAYPVMGHGRGKLAPQKIKMAMAVQGKNRHYRWQEIQARHWLETGRRCGFGDMKSLIQDLVDQTPAVIARVQDQVPKGFAESMAHDIFQGLGARARQLGMEIRSKSGNP